MTARSEPIRVLVVDEDEVFIALAKEWLASEPELVFVGSAPDSRGALAAIARLDPDVVLVGGLLPGLEGLETARQIKSMPRAPLVVITSFSDTESVRLEAWMAGADAFVAKTDLAEKLPAMLAATGTRQPRPSLQSREHRVRDARDGQEL